MFNKNSMKVILFIFGVVSLISMPFLKITAMAEDTYIEPPWEYTDMYCMEANEFREFILNPSLDFLSTRIDKTKEFSFFLYPFLEDDDYSAAKYIDGEFEFMNGIIGNMSDKRNPSYQESYNSNDITKHCSLNLRKYTADGIKYCIGYGEGEFHVSYHPITEDLIEFIQQQLDGYMIENEISASIEEKCIIYADFPQSTYMPLVIWVKTSDNDYFITVNDNVMVSFGDENQYQIYNREQFNDKFGLHNGIFMIDDKEIEFSDVKFEYKAAYIPLRIFVESLGGEINWDSENRTANIIFNGEKYLFRVDKLTKFISENRLNQAKITLGTDDWLPGVGGSWDLGKIIDDRIIIDSTYMDQIALDFGINLTIDWEKRIITANM